MPAERIQRSRRRDWRMPDDAVYVGRPSTWGNPYKLGGRNPVTGRKIETLEEAVELYRAEIATMMTDHPERYSAFILSAQTELGGRTLACWCPLTQPCHADVLLEIANPS